MEKRFNFFSRLLSVIGQCYLIISTAAPRCVWDNNNASLYSKFHLHSFRCMLRPFCLQNTILLVPHLKKRKKKSFLLAPYPKNSFIFFCFKKIVYILKTSLALKSKSLKVYILKNTLQNCLGIKKCPFFSSETLPLIKP